jgi:hypothetical protein
MTHSSEYHAQARDSALPRIINPPIPKPKAYEDPWRRAPNYTAQWLKQAKATNERVAVA